MYTDQSNINSKKICIAFVVSVHNQLSPDLELSFVAKMFERHHHLFIFFLTIRLIYSAGIQHHLVAKVMMRIPADFIILKFFVLCSNTGVTFTPFLINECGESDTFPL